MVSAAQALLVDTDVAADDALAIVLALQTPGVEVAALTTVAGNVSVEQATRNALTTLSVCGRLDVPVHPGASRPLVAEPGLATDVHGADGLGDQWFPPLGVPSPVRAVEATIDLLRRRPGQLTWVALGPLTNLAAALLVDPVACHQVRDVVVMGGVGDGVGNVTPAAEFNFWVDPEAARIVLRAGLPIRLVGWDVCRRDGLVSPADRQRLLNSPHALARFASAVTRRLWEFATTHHHAGMDLPDVLAMVLALAPELGRWRRCFVDVECRGDLTRGASVVDHLAVTGADPNVELCVGADGPAYLGRLLDALTGTDLEKANAERAV